ncbi:MAG: M20/M25/M40 family metallo-hydrolase, partial [Aldersonia sp.]|nr:M20/M25/M40 family metallo-hydrolase [Aldersonia sp.]
MDPTLRLLKQLVATDSVNPTLVPGASGEAAIARVLAEELRGIGLATELQEAAPDRPNVVGVLEGRTPGRSLMFCGHVDTVGVAGMTRPFDPVERNGRIYGRGSQDMKGGVAAMIGAARVIAESGGLDAGRLVIACVVDEEHASIGAEALVTRWKADGGVVTEPTDLQVSVAHKGFEWVEIETEGRAAHGSRPRDGRDAIVRMGRVLTELEALDRELQRGRAHHLVGPSSLHASLIAGGR